VISQQTRKVTGMIAVTGATGEVGRRVVARLASAGVPHRSVVRDPSRAVGDFRIASDYGARDEMAAAFEGADTVFLVPAAENADRVAQHKVAVDAVVAAGVGRLVYLSFLGASADATFTLARDHWATEQHIRATDVRWTFLRMNLYMDFIPNMVGADGVIRGPAGDGRVSAILRDDVAAAAAAVLESDGHDGATYDLTGPSTFSLPEAAALLGARFEDETDEQAYASREIYGAPDWEVRGWVTSYQAIRDGSFDVISPAVRALTGRDPMSLAAYLRA
jgi:NAD(P)H dehydrogenase (quinone)